MTHRSLRLCAILGAIGIAGTACTACALTLAASAAWDAARRGDLITMPWSVR